MLNVLSVLIRPTWHADWYAALNAKSPGPSQVRGFSVGAAGGGRDLNPRQRVRGIRSRRSARLSYTGRRSLAPPQSGYHATVIRE